MPRTQRFGALARFAAAPPAAAEAFAAAPGRGRFAAEAVASPLCTISHSFMGASSVTPFEATLLTNLTWY